MALIAMEPTKRAALQSRLNNRATLKAALDRAREELKLAQVLVGKGERTQVYLQPFKTVYSNAAQAYNALDNVIPNELRNGCADEALRDEFEFAMAIRTRLVAERQHTRNGLKSAEESLAMTKSRIALHRGKPAILKAGDALPWGENFITKMFTKAQIAMGQVSVASWAIRDDDTAISFAPEVLPTDQKFYSDQWFDALKGLRVARTAHVETESRLAEAQTVLDDVKNRMTWSPI